MDRRQRPPGLSWFGTGAHLVACLALIALAGCTADQHRRAADREVYRIISSKERQVHGTNSGFRIDTAYSQRPPADQKPSEVIAERIQDGKKLITLEDALRLAVGNSRNYQTRKEGLYLSALTLSRERYEFRPQFFGTATGDITRSPDQSQDASATSRVGVDQFLKTGARLSAAIANDITTFYIGGKPKTAVSIMSVALTQPLLRGAGSSIVAETLTQAERNVIYEVRSFSRFQQTFAVDIVIAYLRLLQQKDTVRNEFNSYKNATRSRDLSEALGMDGRVSRVQVDQARQRELDARNRYLLAVERFRDSMDTFKGTLNLPLGVELQLDDSAIDDFKRMGLDNLELGEHQGYALAVEKRLDLLNEIDRFEDSQRKVKVAANQLRGDLNFFARSSLDSGNPDYTDFSWDNYRATAGLTLNLPLDRFLERYSYRASFINFERAVRALGQALDDVRDDVRQGLRGLVLARQTYEVQRRSVELAEHRVESTEMFFQAGRVQIRDVLDAQDAQVRAQNAFIQSLIDYHATRLGLLRDLGVLDVDEPRFWLGRHELPAPAPGSQQLAKPLDYTITPEQLFGTE